MFPLNADLTKGHRQDFWESEIDSKGVNEEGFEGFEEFQKFMNVRILRGYGRNSQKLRRS
ncbi:MAG: hypothetical protein DMG49_09220 [Acidobacteria bacterium]|nr:MAG: hypothetical protein DMG49_09220 [Acidobacteriota bacterium]